MKGVKEALATCEAHSLSQMAPIMMPLPILVYHVAPVGNLWKVSIPGDSQPVSFHAAKSEAIAHAARLASQHPQGRVVIHRADGTVEEEHAQGSAGRSG